MPTKAPTKEELKKQIDDLIAHNELLRIQQKDSDDLMGMGFGSEWRRDNSAKIRQNEVWIAQSREMLKQLEDLERLTAPRKDLYIALRDEFENSPSEYRLESMIEEFRRLQGRYPGAEEMAGKCEAEYKRLKNEREAAVYAEAINNMNRYKKSDGQTANVWESYRFAFEGMNYKDSSRLAKECEKRAATIIEKARKKEMIKKAANNVGTTLQVAISALYCFLFFVTDFIKPCNIQDRAVWDDWAAMDFLYISVPLGVYALVIGLISVIFLWRSSRGFGMLLIILVGIIHSITVGLWYTDGRFIQTAGIAIIVAVCGAVVSTIGFGLSFKEIY